MKPYIIVKNYRDPDSASALLPTRTLQKELGKNKRVAKNAVIVGQRNAWMDSARMKHFVQEVILPYISMQRSNLQKNENEYDSVLIFDNFAAHLDDEVLDIIRTNRVKVFCLPPNSTAACQPLDVGVNSHFKRLVKAEYSSKYSAVLNSLLLQARSTIAFTESPDADTNPMQAEKSAIDNIVSSYHELLEVQPIDLCSWVVHAAQRLSQTPSLIVSAWCKASICEKIPKAAELFRTLGDSTSSSPIIDSPNKRKAKKLERDVSDITLGLHSLCLEEGVFDWTQATNDSAAADAQVSSSTNCEGPKDDASRHNTNTVPADLSEADSFAESEWSGADEHDQGEQSDSEQESASAAEKPKRERKENKKFQESVSWDLFADD